MPDNKTLRRSKEPQGADISEAQIAVHWREEGYFSPSARFKAQANLKRRGSHRIIDKVKVRLVASEDKYWAELSNFGDRYVHVPEDIVYKYDRLLQGGIWTQVDLVYNSSEDEGRVRRPFFIETLRPIQVAAFSMEEYQEGRGGLTRDEWLDLLTPDAHAQKRHDDVAHGQPAIPVLHRQVANRRAYIRLLLQEVLPISGRIQSTLKSCFVGRHPY